MANAYARYMAINFKSRRIGITMRVVETDTYTEPRDALAQDWARYMNLALPDANWIPIPNLGEDVVNFSETWQLNGLILSGGNNIGENTLRDTTEQLLLEHFIDNSLPVLAICRGLQLLQTRLGGQIESCEAATHVATQHEVNIREDPSNTGWSGTRQVNSFHSYGIRESNIHPSLRPLASTQDGWVEAAQLEDKMILGLMWHPEREIHYSATDISIIQWLFGYQSNR